MDKWDHKAHCIVYEKIPKNELITGACRENIVNAIAAALRQEANEAAWDMHRMKCDCERAAIICMFGVVEELEAEMVAKYGPRPEGGEQ